MGAGDLVNIGCPAADSYGVVGLVLIGGDWFLGAGILVEIACPLVKSVGVMWAVFVVSSIRVLQRHLACCLMDDRC